MQKSIVIIGGGPAGLMAAQTLCESGIRVDVYESMPSLGRKFLMAGKSGLNLTHSEDYALFKTRFGDKQKTLEAYLDACKPKNVIAWANELGIETFVGSSGRVFPKEMKASPLLRAWIQRLQNHGVNFYLRHRWVGWQDDSLMFETPTGVIKKKADATILALGGASWPKLGSRADWVPMLVQAGVNIKPFVSANCGFVVNWSKHFSDKFHGDPVKSVILTTKDFKQQGEFVVTKTGVEGSLIYSASAKLRDEIFLKGSAALTLDLAPDVSKENLLKALSRPRGSQTMSNHIKKTVGLQGVKLGLLYEYLCKEDFTKIEKLAETIKALTIPLVAPSATATAISCAGGVDFAELDAYLMLHKIPGVFCAGEMLDWEAPTGGYLLTACFATGKAAGEGVLRWLNIAGA